LWYDNDTALAQTLGVGVLIASVEYVENWDIFFVGQAGQTKLSAKRPYTDG